MGSHKMACLGCLLVLSGCANGAARELGGTGVDPILGANTTGGMNGMNTGAPMNGNAGATGGDNTGGTGAGETTGNGMNDADGGDSGGSTGADSTTNANGEPDSSFPPPSPSGLIFSEVMATPDKGTGNEWLELFNSGDESIDLQGCELSTGEAMLSGHALDAALTIAPGAYLLLGRDDLETESGVKPDYVYDGVYLSADETVTIACNGQIVSQVRYADAESATSLQLDARYVAAGKSDVQGTWCNGSDAFPISDNLGTPKAANRDCAGVPAP